MMKEEEERQKQANAARVPYERKCWIDQPLIFPAELATIEATERLNPGNRGDAPAPNMQNGSLNGHISENGIPPSGTLPNERKGSLTNTQKATGTGASSGPSGGGKPVFTQSGHIVFEFLKWMSTDAFTRFDWRSIDKDVLGDFKV